MNKENTNEEECNCYKESCLSQGCKEKHIHKRYVCEKCDPHFVKNWIEEGRQVQDREYKLEDLDEIIANGLLTEEVPKFNGTRRKDMVHVEVVPSEEEINYVNVGKTVACGHCQPNHFTTPSYIKCECVCHNSVPPEEKLSWEEELYKILYEKCGNLEITNGELVDGTTKPIFDFFLAHNARLIERCEEVFEELIKDSKGREVKTMIYVKDKILKILKESNLQE